MPQRRAVSDAGNGIPDVVAGVRAALAAHRPVGEREVEATGTIARALARPDPPLDERAGLEHLTASGVVVGRRGTVLHLHKRLHRWLQPGGHLEPGEAPWEAARREATEETGLPVRHPPGGPRLIHVDVHPAAAGHVHLDLRYLLVAPDDDPTPAPGESPQARWFGWDEASAVADEALVGALRAARAEPEVDGGAERRRAGNGRGEGVGAPSTGGRRVRGVRSSRHNGGDGPRPHGVGAPRRSAGGVADATGSSTTGMNATCTSGPRPRGSR